MYLKIDYCDLTRRRTGEYLLWRSICASHGSAVTLSSASSSATHIILKNGAPAYGFLVTMGLLWEPFDLRDRLYMRQSLSPLLILLDHFRFPRALLWCLHLHPTGRGLRMGWCAQKVCFVPTTRGGCGTCSFCHLHRMVIVRDGGLLSSLRFLPYLLGTRLILATCLYLLWQYWPQRVAQC